MNNNFHLVLYRKYRPQNFGEVVGQNHITEMLKKSVSSNRISHSYLFSGPKGTGKTSMARILAKAVNCINERETAIQDAIQDGEPRVSANYNTTGEPCNICISCDEITNGRSLDLIEIDAASNRGIDEIRALKEAVWLNPLKSKYRVYIIDEVHMLTKEAFNALLKTLEEPPQHSIFILATTEREKIPETITSRCEQFKFKKMTDENVKFSLKNILEKEKIKIGEEALSMLAILADGSLRDAHSKLEQCLNFEKKEIQDFEVRNFFGLPAETQVENFLKSIILKNSEEAVKIAREIQKDEIDARLFIKLVLRSLRFLMLLLLSPQTENEIKNLMSPQNLEFIKSLKLQTNVSEIENLLKFFLDAYLSPVHSYFPELPLEMALAEIFKRQS